MKRKTLLLMMILALFSSGAWAQTQLWSENFENYTSSTLGSEWGRPATYGDKPNVLISNNNWAPPQGYKALEMRTNTSTTIMAVLPQFDKNLNTLTVQFKLGGHAYGRGQFGYVTNASEANTFVSLTDIAQPSTVGNGTSGYTQYNYDLSTLSAPANSSYRLAIKYWFVTGSSATEDSWYFDDFSVTYTEPSGGGDADGLTVADGSGANATIPFNGLYADDNYQHTQTIYPSSMLTDMVGGQITKLTYYANASVTKNYGSTFEVRIGTTTTSSFINNEAANYLSPDNLTLVYSNTLSVNGTTVVFDFSNSPFTYSRDNLVVDVRITTLGSGYNSIDFKGNSGDGINYSIQNMNGSSVPATGTTTQFMPKTTFSYIVPPPPTIALSPSSATVVTGHTETLTATYDNVTGTPTITYSSSNTNVATVTGSGTTATVTGVAPGTATITATMNGSYTATCAITVEDPSYCEPSFSNPSDDYISNFTTTGGDSNINNRSTYESGGYSDYYNSYSASIEQGGTLTCSVTPSSTQWSYGHAIWVDWNNDYTFGSDERVAYTSSTAKGVWTANFTVPATTAPGDYRMRVIHLYNNTPTDPCMSDTYGEAEDYKLTVLSTVAYTIAASANPTEGGTVTFMTGAASSTAHTHLPLDSYRNNSFSQQIYTPEEIGGGTINSISLFSVYGNLNDGINYTRNLDVYLVHTSKTEFSSNSDWIAVTNADKVFSGNVEFICGEWNTINFTTSFNYNGTSNLALIIADNTNETAASGNYLECRTFEPSSGVYCSLNLDTQFNPSSPSGNGERLKQKNQILVNGSAIRTFPANATCTLVATANENYHFVNWTENNSQVSTNATYSFNVTGDHTLVANFEPNSHTVTIVSNNADYGTVSPSSIIVPHGATITTSGNTLTVNGTTVTANTAQATAQYTYAFSNWSNVPATVTGDVSITANFTQTVNSYTVTIEPNDANYGSVSPVSVTSVPYGTTITPSDNTLTVGSTTVTATPQASTAQYTYAFSNWSNVPATVTGDVIITANFTQTANSYTINLVVNPTAGGTVSAEPAGPYHYNDEVTITATANDGYTFGSWSDNGAQSHTVTITGDATYTATFTQNEYTLTLTAEPAAGGEVSASPAQATYHYGDVVTVTATPNSGYTFGSWSDSGAAQHTITIADDTELTAYFGADQTLTTYANPIEGGYVTIAPVSNIGCDTIGTTYTSATAVGATTTPFSTQQNYSYQQCLYLASEIASAGWITSISYEVFGNQQAQNDHIEVFMKNTTRTSAFSTSVSSLEPITASDKVFDGTWNIPANGWATIVLDRPFYYDGNSLVIGIHENSPGYTATSFVKTDCASYYRFTCYSMTDDMDPLNLESSTTFSRGKDRANVRLGFGTYHNGESIALTAHANPGYQFTGWTVDGTADGNTNPYPVTMNANHNVVANFEARWTFVHAGNWNVPTNWLPVGQPGASDDVYIEAAAIIPANCTAEANTVTINGGSITIEDGGQLQHNNSGVTVTTQKSITGYGSDNAQTNKGYYLISSPVDGIAASNVTGLQTSQYDLYKFVSNNEENGNLLEWVHVGDNGSLVRNEGYIYASRTDTRIKITGTVLPSNNTISKTLTYNDGYRFGGWNLIGNPFVCNAYVNVANYYILNDQTGYNEFVATDNSHAIAPMSGLMVVATATGQSVTYSRTAPSKGSGILNIDVNRTMDRGTTMLDRARVRFGEGEGLQKFQFNPNHTKVYIPQDGSDYAVVYADGAGTIPVNFKAQDNGRYTLDFSTEEVSFNYLHLIDNMNGNDVDLLQTPYYAFDAKSTDFASRFTLVFATGSSTGSETGNFAFFNNGVWIINNDGNAELQVVDVLGHILSSETISGSCSKAINVAPGVYMLRLINGNDVKVQKVVVR